MSCRLNDLVVTPVGRGIVQGRFEGGILVRVALSGSVVDGRCVTPRARKSSLWVFEAGELKRP